MDNFSATLDWALRLTLLISVPASIGLIVLAGPILATLFLGGQFGINDVAMAQLSLIAYAVGLLGMILVKVLVPGFYARQDTKTPVKIGIIALTANMALNLIFVLTLVQLEFIGTHMGLALATSCSAFINAGLLLRSLRRNQIYSPKAGWYTLLLKLSLASATMALGLGLGIEPLSVWQAWDLWERIFHLLKWLLLGIVLYGATLHVTGIRLKQFLHSKT